jgi:periplasmic divalent cation tolerance protein
MTNARIVLTTAGSADEARKIAQALVERRLAACVNIVPQIESVYRWQSKIESASESLLLIKTHAGAFEGVRATIEALHSYEMPECIMLEVDAGGQEYLDWIAASVD